MLAHLSGHAKVSVRDVYDRVAMDKVKVSRAAAQLKASGYIVKDVHPTDHRLVELQLSERGRALVAKIAPLALAYENEVLSRLSETEQTVFIAVMRKLIAPANSGRKGRTPSATTGHRDPIFANGRFEVRSETAIEPGLRREREMRIGAAPTRSDMPTVRDAVLNLLSPLRHDLDLRQPWIHGAAAFPQVSAVMASAVAPKIRICGEASGAGFETPWAMRQTGRLSLQAPRLIPYFQKIIIITILFPEGRRRLGLRSPDFSERPILGNRSQYCGAFCHDHFDGQFARKWVPNPVGLPRGQMHVAEMILIRKRRPKRKNSLGDRRNPLKPEFVEARNLDFPSL